MSFIGGLLAGVIRSKLISVQLDHPVAAGGMTIEGPTHSRFDKSLRKRFWAQFPKTEYSSLGQARI